MVFVQHFLLDQVLDIVCFSDQTLRPTILLDETMLQCFAALSTKLYHEASHVRFASQSRIAILFFKPRLLALFATKMADEEDLVVVELIRADSYLISLKREYHAIITAVWSISFSARSVNHCLVFPRLTWSFASSNTTSAFRSCVSAIFSNSAPT